MSMGGRLTMCNMAVEMGGKAGMVEPDEKTLAYLRERTKKSFEIVRADKDAVYEKVVEFDVSKLEPQVACPHTVDNVRNISRSKAWRSTRPCWGRVTAAGSRISGRPLRFSGARRFPSMSV